ncbi:hypothetical protein IKE79_02060 [Candidatus Saccharibacteria bacterium]|nr:hypothetical protein [Candidatus Saccharibacteria bacterium]
MKKKHKEKTPQPSKPSATESEQPTKTPKDKKKAPKLPKAEDAVTELGAEAIVDPAAEPDVDTSEPSADDAEPTEEPEDNSTPEISVNDDVEPAPEPSAKKPAKSYKVFKRILIAIAIIALAAGAIFGAILIIKQQKAAADEAAAAQLEADYRSGTACLPADRAADFTKLENTCVDFHVVYVNDSRYYVFANDDKDNATFAIMMNKHLITTDDAISRYLGKHLEVRGAIEKYQDIYVVKVTDFSQIKITE